MLEIPTYKSFPKASSLEKDKFKSQFDFYHHKYTTNNKTLVINTRLYHGSFSDKNPLTFQNPVLFGLDSLISIWYCNEMETKPIAYKMRNAHKKFSDKAGQRYNSGTTFFSLLSDLDIGKFAPSSTDGPGRKNARKAIEDLHKMSIVICDSKLKDAVKNYDAILSECAELLSQRYYFLHEFEVVREFAYNYANTTDVLGDYTDDKPNVKPQFAYHCDTCFDDKKYPVELCIEVSLHPKDFSKIKRVATYIIDTTLLNKNKTKSFTEFDPRNAVVGKIKI